MSVHIQQVFFLCWKKQNIAFNIISIALEDVFIVFSWTLVLNVDTLFSSTISSTLLVILWAPKLFAVCTFTWGWRLNVWTFEPFSRAYFNIYIFVKKLINLLVIETIIRQNKLSMMIHNIDSTLTLNYFQLYFLTFLIQVLNFKKM